MCKAIFFLTLILYPILFSNAQSVTSEQRNREIKESSLLTELHALETDATKLNSPLAFALAKAEIASAGWTLDREWAMKILREAYELTLPPEAEQIKLREKPAGAPLTLSTSNDWATNAVRQRVLSVASRDKSFGEELVKFGLEKLGNYEAYRSYADLAHQAAQTGDKELASTYVLKAIEADPTYLGPVDTINELAMKDRAAADSLIIQYIDRLRKFPLSYQNQSTQRTSFMLNLLVYPRSLSQPQRNIPAPGVAVMRAYAGYEVERFSKLDDDTLRRVRSGLLFVWEPLKQYAPELTRTFMELEGRSRAPGDNSPLPTQKSLQEQNKERYEKRLKDALESGVADELTINFAISRGDFERARKLISKLPDGAQKIQFTDIVNTKEAVNLAARGDITGAEHLAEQLTRTVSLLEAYPAIINGCRADKTRACIPSLLVSKAVRQLKRADSTPAAPPAGIPASVVPSNREFDPLLSGLSKLAALIAPLDRQLALEVLDEVIAAANSSTLDTTQGRTGIDTELFRRLAPGNEVRVRQSAETLKDRLRRIVALAAVYQGKAAELAQSQKQHIR